MALRPVERLAVWGFPGIGHFFCAAPALWLVVLAAYGVPYRITSLRPPSAGPKYMIYVSAATQVRLYNLYLILVSGRGFSEEK